MELNRAIPNATAASVPISIIHQVVDHALLAPSGDNCQPWQYAWNGQCLRISHVEERGHHALNERNLASELSLGTVLTSIEVSARSVGWEPAFHLTKALGSLGNEPWVEVFFTPGASETESLLSALAQRCTNRLPYLKKPFDDEVLQRVHALSTPEVRVRALKVEDPALVNSIARTESILWQCRRYQSDLLKWIRWTDRQTLQSRDGLGWRQLGVSFAQVQALRPAQWYPFQSVLNKLGFLRSYRASTRHLLRQSAGLLVFTGKSFGPRIAVNTGRVAMSTWLTVTHAGYSAQPLSLSSLGLFYHRLGFMSEDQATVFDALDVIMRSKLELPENESVLWMFRAGIAPVLGKRQRSLRRSREDHFQDFSAPI